MGTLDGVRVIEMAGIGPAPFCCMLLADMGAEVLRIDRLVASDLGVAVPSRFDLLNRNKRSAALDLKSAQGIETAKTLIAEADILIEGFRPGVMEKMGLGPDVCLDLNPRLVYGRMTGWGQDGPLSQAAAHDLNFIALSGMLSTIGHKGQAPAIPLNVIGDFGGGALYLAMGVLAAVIQARVSGKGQVVDAAIVDGVSNLLAMQYGFKQMNIWSDARGSGLLNGGAPFYNVYLTKDGGYVSIASVEEKFYAELIERIGLNADDLPNEEGRYAAELPEQNDQASWAHMQERFAEIFKTRTRAEWCEILEGTDACFAPVLDMDEAPMHPHFVARKMFADVDGVLNPQPAPRFSRTPSELKRPPPKVGADTAQALSDWGMSAAQIAELKEAKVIA
ncbi:MAG: CoA transferase [Rhodocyclaceae bacterium]|nr:CoA transferase [Rhodocyclaceae bacterium]